jgi:hypothetical protein
MILAPDSWPLLSVGYVQGSNDESAGELPKEWRRGSQARTGQPWPTALPETAVGQPSQAVPRRLYGGRYVEDIPLLDGRRLGERELAASSHASFIEWDGVAGGQLGRPR